MPRLLLSLAFVIAAVGMAAAQGAQSERAAVATFADGCFWRTEADFDKVLGVISTTSGYTGGHAANPSCEQVSSGGTGHAEAVEVACDPSKVTYEKLLTYFWHHIDPLVKDAQFCGQGEQYCSAIFVRNDEERKLAEASAKQVEAELQQPIYTQIVAAGPFYKAEDDHQDFYQKNSTKYKFYQWNCGRDQRLEQVWGAAKGDG
jgi:peptide-methionine (S)-S-oxide reductase